MGLNIKKPNYLDTSLITSDDHEKTYNELLKINSKHPFVLFKDLLTKSWETKEFDLKEGEELNKFFANAENVSLTPDSLKNKSLITYIDAPWGSGKTYFIENLIRWIKKSNNEEEFDFGENKSKLNIEVLDAWEIYNDSNIEEVLKNIFKPNIDNIGEYVKKNVEKYIDGDNEAKKKQLFSKIKRYGFIANAFLTYSPTPIQPFFAIGNKAIKKANNFVGKIPIEYSKQLINSTNNEFLEKYNNISQEILTKSIIDYIEDEYENNNKFIVIDNIERLSSRNRLDVINKIMNWANLKGTTYLFLTNFQKINFSTLFEEDFWNKISLHETFKLTNSWESYISNYKGNEFDLSLEGNEEGEEGNKDLKDFILNIIPVFFSSNEDNMDIREIKKLLDNWEDKKKLNNNKELIISLLKEIVDKNLEGLDKYYFINHTISWLSENKWDLWSDDLDLSKIEEDIDNTPLINNKMFRIQSNFYRLEVVKDKDGTIKFNNSNGFKIDNSEIDFFKKFNNFIDDTASHKFQKVIRDILSTREIDDKKNYILKYMDLINKEEIKYFEFKYNNIKKIHIYNEIFG